MTFQPDEDTIAWRLHLRSSPAAVYDLLATDAGRARFWAEEAIERDGAIDFVFPGGQRWRGAILVAEPARRFSVRYYGDSITTFTLTDDGDGGAELHITDTGVAPEYRTEVIAGWVSVLMALKAAADYGVDLRNHDPARSWEQGYVEN